MKMIFYNILLTLIASVFIGCTHIVNKYRVTVDAITNSDTVIRPTTYIIKPLGEDTDSNDLKFQRQSSRLAKILNLVGYKQVNSQNLAGQIIYFDYGIEKIKEETRTYSEPDVSFGFSWGYPYRYGYPYYSPFWSDIGYSSYRTYRKTYRLFNRYIVILSKDQLGKELWRVDVSSVGESNNLQKIVPILIRASKPYIGRNIDKPVNIVLEE
ncbi:MAG TPA: hypothetical protein ENK88_08340 [Campylobacterales bacterium]|nr:hypothetical protein [Campylobacterales bacterium]